MEPIYRLLEGENYSFARRSRPSQGDLDADILVVDVFGELVHFYEVANVCYIGRNHGVLEPLRFHKPVVVAPEQYWASDYVTFPHYDAMVRAEAICQTECMDKTGAAFLHVIEDAEFRESMIGRAVEFCERQRDGLARIIAHVRGQFADTTADPETVPGNVVASEATPSVTPQHTARPPPIHVRMEQSSLQ